MTCKESPRLEIKAGAQALLSKVQNFISQKDRSNNAFFKYMVVIGVMSQDCREGEGTAPSPASQWRVC